MYFLFIVFVYFCFVSFYFLLFWWTYSYLYIYYKIVHTVQVEEKYNIVKMKKNVRIRIGRVCCKKNWHRWLSCHENNSFRTLYEKLCSNIVIGCVLFENLTNLDRFVRWDRSSQVKKNVQIFLVVMGVVNLFSSAPQTTPSFTCKETTPAPGTTNGRG